MTEYRQKIMEILGRDGCYFLSLVRLAENITGKRIDAIPVYLEAIERQFMDADCFLVQPHRVLEIMTGKRWTVRKEDRRYQVQPGELEVLRYERTVGRTTIGHFVLPDYDPLGKSLTVQNGYLVSKRIFKGVT
jgi:hypothetical protein